MRIRTLLAFFPAALAAAAALTLAAGSAPAEAAFPGMNGKIAFSADGFIHSVKPDGSGRTQLTSSGSDYSPDWSPDGQKIAFAGYRDGNEDIYVMNADGSGQTKLTNHPASDSHPTWSPDGQRIAFSSSRGDGDAIYVMNADGSGQTRLYHDSNYYPNDERPAWSPVGWKIAYERGGHSHIWVMNADGAGRTQLTWSDYNYSPAWSPDGKRIAFERSRNGNREIYVMNANGSGQTNLTNNVARDEGPDWSPDRLRIVFSRELPDGTFQIYVMNADGSGTAPVPGAFGWGADWQSLPIELSLPPLPPPPPPPPPPPLEVAAAFPESTTVEAGTLIGGSARSLSADDDVYFEVSSTTTGTSSETKWYGSMTLPNELTSLKLAYTGKYSHACTQQLELRDFDAGSWVVLDSRSVGTTEVEVVVKSPAGRLDRFVSGNSGRGELHLRVSCTSGDGDFVASGELMQVVYGLP